MQRHHRQQKIDLVRELLEHPKDFSFIQAIRILSKKLGGDYLQKIEIRPCLSLGFPTNDVVKIEKKEGRFIVTVTFLGLYGSSSPLPTFYTEELIEEKNNERSVKRDFIDIFNKRIYEFYFLLWLKTHPGVLLKEYKQNEIKKLFVKITFPLSVMKLKHILAAYGLQCEIREFVSDYALLEEKQTTRLSERNNILAENSHLGNRVKHTDKFSIVLKKMNKRSFFRFLQKIKTLNDEIYNSLSESLNWEWEVEFNKPQKFALGEMNLGINSVVGENRKLKIKGKKW